MIVHNGREIMKDKITIMASGSRGDVQPYVALGKGLAAAGYTVRVVSSDDFAAMVQEAGLEFCSTGYGVETLLQRDEWRAATEGGNMLTLMARMNAEMKTHAARLAAATPTLIEGSDLLIGGAGGLGGAFTAALKMGIPILQAYLFPLTPTAAYSGPLTPSLPLGGLLNRPSHTLTRMAIWQMVRATDVATRKNLALPGGSPLGPFGDLEKRRIPVLYGFSRHVLPKPADWDERTHVTGYWFLDPSAAWMPPTDLVDFLAGGAPPVYIGFGSMASRNPREAADIALAALAKSGQRGVVASGWGGMQKDDLPSNVFMLSSIPHSWLFPQMAAVVHHGGAGTTAAGLRAGVPSIVIPFMADQPFWGQQVARLGVGTPPIARKRLTADALAGAITAALDGGVRARAADLGAKIRAEDGVANAVELVGRYAS
jgi:sterol 3beta-glucosyltransferase